MSIVSRARPEIRELRPYASARAMAGLAPVTLNANENPWPASHDAGLNLNRYPDPQPARLVAAWAEALGAPPECLLVTRGSDEAIDLLVRAFCRAGLDAVAQCPPTFGMYAISARIQGAAVLDVPLLPGAFELDVDSVVTAALGNAVPLVFLCRPNNPTGGNFRVEQLTTLLEALKERSLVVVDEAYIDFCPSESVLELTASYENLAVLRTLSKAHALAGARCGALVAAPEVIDLLKRILPPYPLPTPTIAAAQAALQPEQLAAARRQAARLADARDALGRFLKSLPGVTQVWPSQANFVLLQVADGPALVRWLAERGVLVRDFNAMPGLDNCLRITAGSPPENARLMQLLEQWSK